MVRGRQAGVVRDFQSTPTVQQKLGTVRGADSSRASHTHTHTQKIPTAKTNSCTTDGEVHVCKGAEKNGGKKVENSVRIRWKRQNKIFQNAE